jgi:carboxyl-terminal processing protease
VEAVKSVEAWGFFSRFIFDHLESDRNRYKDWSEPDFVQNFKIDDIMFNNFINYAENSPLVKNLNLPYYELEDNIKLFLKADLAEQLYGDNAAAKIKGTNDAMLQKVLQLDGPKVSRQKTAAIGSRD